MVLHIRVGKVSGQKPALGSRTIKVLPGGPEMVAGSQFSNEEEDLWNNTWPASVCGMRENPTARSSEWV